MASFGSAFASAKKAGKKTFTWNGKSYTTKTKEESGNKKAPVPKSRGERPKSPVKGVRVPKGPNQSPAGKSPSQSEVESMTGVKMKSKKRFLRGSMMTGSMRKKGK